MQKQVAKKRATNLYFFTCGQLAAYKILSKGFNHGVLVEMMVSEISQVRLWEIVVHTCQVKPNAVERTVTQA